ncbi:unnamed protein product [Cladocopium goreaui]|uniref:Uncharacterized protein n=1 Tax=Cladocopium goreaui TaxID=2562237 RepID=A0A9P1D697_9DINO|nr:unnamed protein product [Cladocopium goreaui]
MMLMQMNYGLSRRFGDMMRLQMTNLQVRILAGEVLRFLDPRSRTEDDESGPPTVHRSTVDLRVGAIDALHSLTEASDQSVFAVHALDPARITALLKAPPCDCGCRLPADILKKTCRSFWSLPKQSQDALLWFVSGSDAAFSREEEHLKEELLKKLIHRKLTGPTVEIMESMDPTKLPVRELPPGTTASLYVMYLAFCKDFDEHAKLCNQLLSHYSDQYKDRLVYWAARARSSTEGDILRMIVDSFDRSKLQLPAWHLRRTPKRTVYETINSDLDQFFAEKRKQTWG